MKRALVLLAPGAEEIETVTPVDVLRRAGVEVVLAGLEGPQPVAGRSGVRLVPDAGLADVSGDFDAIVLPGGAEGAEALARHPGVQSLLRRQESSGKLIAAICAAPVALVAAGAGRGKALTSHPSVKDRVEGHGRYREERVVRDAGLVTSRGPGTALEFSLAIVEELLGEEAARSVGGPMLAAAT